MPARPGKILIVEDSPSQARIYRAQLESAGYDTVLAETGQAASHLVSESGFSCILLDLKLPDMNGLDLMRQWQGSNQQTPIIVITAHGSVKTAIEAVKLGAFDFLMKPFDGQRLMTTLNNALDHSELKSVVQTYKQKIDRDQFCDFVGNSLAMQTVYRTLEGAATSKASVFITGESGTGKELAATAVHQLSPRAAGRFVAINCGAIPKELMESELFGHVKGAFTGATSDHQGAAGLADGGTLFLDEICEMDINLQTKLLRFIQLGTYKKVGGKTTQQCDIRFVAATNRDPQDYVRQGKLREDLYYRLHVIPVRLPPLRERGEDVLQIARHFLEQFNHEEGKAFETISHRAEQLMLSYGWPGNVRELENAIRNNIVLKDGPELTDVMLAPLLSNTITASALTAAPAPAAGAGEAGGLTHIPALARTHHAHSPGVNGLSGAVRPLWQTERDAIQQAITSTNGNIQKAARLLEISPSTIYRKKEDWQKRSDQFPPG